MGTINAPSNVPVTQLFTRKEIVGKGAYGQVFKSVYNPTGQIVAIKCIELDTADDDISDIQREVALLTQLREADRNNCTVYHGCWLHHSELWIAMDFAAGGSIRTIMRSCKFIEERFSVVIIREVLVAMAYLHRQSIIHRDIKAANILLTQTGRILLCDFGVAAHLQTTNKRSTFVGTPYWMAPEVIQDGQLYDTKADIWSLGVTLYEMSNGNPPFANYEALRAIQMIPRQPPAKLDASAPFSLILREFMSFCLQEDPKERMTAEDLSRTKWIRSAIKQPISILRELIARYTSWVAAGGVRQSIAGVEISPETSFETESTASWEFNSPVPDEAIAAGYTGSGLGSDLSCALPELSRLTHADPQTSSNSGPAPRSLARLFETDQAHAAGMGFIAPPMKPGNSFGLMRQASEPSSTGTIRPTVMIPTLPADSDDEDASPRRAYSPATIRAPSMSFSGLNAGPLVVDTVQAGPKTGSPRIPSSPRMGAINLAGRSGSTLSPSSSQNDGLNDLAAPLSSSPSLPSFPSRPTAQDNSPHRNRAYTAPSSDGPHRPPLGRTRSPATESPSREVTLPPVYEEKPRHVKKPSGSRPPPLAPMPTWQPGVKIQPLDYASLTTSAEVNAELDRVLNGLGSWLDALDAGLASLTVT